MRAKEQRAVSLLAHYSLAHTDASKNKSALALTRQMSVKFHPKSDGAEETSEGCSSLEREEIVQSLVNSCRHTQVRKDREASTDGEIEGEREIDWTLPKSHNGLLWPEPSSSSIDFSGGAKAQITHLSMLNLFSL